MIQEFRRRLNEIKGGFRENVTGLEKAYEERLDEIDALRAQRRDLIVLFVALVGVVAFIILAKALCP